MSVLIHPKYKKFRSQYNRALRIFSYRYPVFSAIDKRDIYDIDSFEKVDFRFAFPLKFKKISSNL